MHLHCLGRPVAPIKHPKVNLRSLTNGILFISSLYYIVAQRDASTSPAKTTPRPVWVPREEWSRLRSGRFLLI